MTVETILKELEQFTPDQPVTLVFTITAGQVTDGDYEKIHKDPTVSNQDGAAVNRLNVQISQSLFCGRADIKTHYLHTPGRGIYSGTAPRKMWEEVLSADKLPDNMIPTVGKNIEEPMRSSLLRHVEREYATNPFREPYVRIALAETQPVPA